MARPVRIVITGGGTGGHVQPAVAIARELRARGPAQILWIGSRDGVEREAAASEQIPFQSIATGKLRRYLSLHTVTDAFRIPLGIVQARRKLRDARPDAVFATGGFVSVPAVIAARWLGIPCLSHEQTATVGLATRINARFCDVIALAYPDSARQLSRVRARTVVTGNPIRQELLNGRPERGFAHFELDPALPLIYVTGGALGAHALNIAVSEALPSLLEAAQIVHQCGPASANGDYARLLKRRGELPETQQRRYAVVERVGPELSDLYAAASLIVSRAGAGTVSEIATLGKPAILVPLPGSGGDEQTRNARVLADASAALLLPQSERLADDLRREIPALLRDEKRRDEMATRARQFGHQDAARRLTGELLRLAHGPEAAAERATFAP